MQWYIVDDNGGVASAVQAANPRAAIEAYLDALGELRNYTVAEVWRAVPTTQDMAALEVSEDVARRCDGSASFPDPREVVSTTYFEIERRDEAGIW